MSIKRRTIEAPFEVKSVKASGRFVGLASPFGELDDGNDIVMPGAFTKTLADYKRLDRFVPMVWQHNTREPIGMYPELKETATGLEVEGECNMKVQRGTECHALMDQRALTGLSMGYTPVREEFSHNDGVRILHEVKLWEISPVTFPMADSARVSLVKSMEGIASLADCENILRDAGFSRKEATAFTARVKAIATQGDPADGVAESINRALAILKSK